MMTPGRLFLRVSLFVVVAGLLFLAVLPLADGKTDAFYLRFTTPRQSSLILGTSRAAQGLNPDVLNDVLGADIYNYAFTLGQSPYGPTYLRSIKAKLDTTKGNGWFILSVDPYSISIDREVLQDGLPFPEEKLCLGNTPNVTSNPNFTYLKNNLGGKYYQILMPKLKPVELQPNGWLQVSVDMSPEASKKRREIKLKDYRENVLPQYVFSATRYDYLRETITYLSRYGKVYLVRLPVHPQMAEIDEQLDPDFNRRMENLVPLVDGYLDMFPLNAQFLYTDGNHLAQESVKEVSEYVGEWIREIREAD